jgi:MFS family permease
VRFKRTGLWRHPDFVRLWVGQTVSIFGSQVGGLAMDFTAVLWLGATPVEISLLSACRLVPGFAVGLVAGVWVDRLRRRPIMIIADFGRALALASVPLAAVLGRLTVEQLYLVALLTSALGVFFGVAYEAYLPTLVEREDLVEGNSKLAATASVSEFGAFSASGWLVQLFSGPGAILIDSVSFLASAFSIGRIRAPEPSPASRHERRPLLREVEEGLKLVARSAVLRTIAATNIILQFASRLVGVTFLLYLNREVGFGPGVLGMIFAVGGLTSLAGTAVAGRWAWFGGLGPALVISIFVRGAGMLFMPLAASVSAIGVTFLVANQVVTDPAWTFYEINEISLRQSIAPDRLQGRMNASMRFLEFGAMLLGTLAGGVLGQTLGLRETLFIAVGITFVAGLWLLISPVAALRVMPPPLAADPLSESSS